MEFEVFDNEIVMYEFMERDFDRLAIQLHKGGNFQGNGNLRDYYISNLGDISKKLKYLAGAMALGEIPDRVLNSLIELRLKISKLQTEVMDRYHGVSKK